MANTKHYVLSRTALAVCAMGTAGCSSGSGSAVPSVIEDMEWQGLIDGDDAGSATYDEAPRAIRLSEFSADGRPGTRLILLLGAAGWCAPCQAEASAIGAFAADYQPRGVATLTAIIQDADSNPADIEFARLWAETFSLTVPTLIDTDFSTSKYFDITAMPSSILIAANTLEILAITVGADTGPDPLRKYRELVDYHLSQP